MSLTPLDETNGEPGDAEKPPSERESSGSIAGSLLGRVRTVLHSVVTSFGRPFQSPDAPIDVPQRRLDEGDTGESTVRPVERSCHLVESESVAGQSASNVFASVEGEPSSDRPELVATWDESGLTLSEPGDSDARISSDTWTETEL